MRRVFNVQRNQHRRHRERSKAESKDPVEIAVGFATGFLDFAQNDSKLGAGQFCRRRACLISPTRQYMPIVTIALDRLATGFTDGVFQRCYGLLLRRGGAGHVENLFLQNCAV
jgi:hypothetical protein